MIIKYENENIKTDVKKEIRKFKPDNITLFFNFLNDNVGELIIRCSKIYFKNYIDTEIKENFQTKFNSTYKKLVISDLNLNDVLFDFLISKELTINPYHKNLKNIKIGESSCNYWIDTLKVIVGKKQIKYDKISFNNVQMIFEK